MTTTGQEMHVRPGRPAGSATRPTEQRASDQAKLAELYLHGFSTADMAVRLGLTRRTVQAELSAIRKGWRTRTHLDFQSALFQQLDRIDLIEKYAYDGWERSLGQVSVETRQATASSSGQVTRATVRTGNGVGDRGFLAQMAWCVEQRCKILGLEKPVAVEVRGTFVEIALGIDWAALALQRPSRAEGPGE